MIKYIHVICIVLFILLSFAKIPPPKFDFQTFNDPSSFLLNGNATLDSGSLSLNSVTPLSYGSVWFYERVYINNFRTSFTISIEGANETTGGDGIAFVIQSNHPNALARNEGGIGYGSGVDNKANTGIAKSISVEFDTYIDVTLNDPSNNHVSIHTNLTGANSANEDFSLNKHTLVNKMRNSIFNITITWEDKFKILAIEYNKNTIAILSANADLYEILNTTDEVWIGFTSSTNEYPDSHKILNWTFSYNSEISSENSFAFGFSNITAGNTASFYVQAVDQYAHNISSDNQNFSISIGGVEVDAQYVGEGLYKVEKAFTEAKDYQVSVQYKNQTLKGSPYTFTVFPAKVDPSQTSTNGKMSGVAGAYITFQIVLKDVYGNVATNAPPNTSIDVKITGPGTVESNHTIAEQGIITVGYTTRTLGTYSISVSVEGVNINGSPFTAVITDGTIDAAFCSATGQGVSAYGNVTTDNNFAITIRDQYQNVITVQPSNMTIYIQVVGPKGNFPLVSYHWDDTTKTYQASYKTTAAGFYLVHIKINDEPIAGSPYGCRVLPETEAYPNNTRVSGITPAVNAGYQNVFYVTTYDQYGNQLQTNTSQVFAQVFSSFENVPTIISYAGHGTYAVYWSSKFVNWGIFITIFVDNVRVAQFETSINASVIDPNKCSLDGTGYTTSTKGTKSSITLRAKDSYDNVVKGHHSFTVSIRNIDNPKINIPASIQSVGDGTFNIFYVPKNVGDFVIEIQYRGEDIRGSPSFLVVYDSVNWSVVVGLAIGSVVLVTIIFGIAYFYWLKYKSKYEYQVLDEDNSHYDD